jgi:mannose-1-phosphate guanylyltransferase
MGEDVKTEPAVYAAILAGGGGTRLWPLSRAEQPKHLLRLRCDRSLVGETFARLQPLIAPDHVMAITVAHHAQTVLEHLPNVPRQNIVIEPQGRSTGPCVGLMAALIHKRDPQAIMVSLHADHAIQDQEGFRGVLRAAIRAAEDDHLVTLGIVPSGPETGYGYIQRGDLLGQAAGHEVYRVERFLEKPDPEKAKACVDSGRYFWNSGMFVWKASVILGEVRRLMPDLYEQLMEIAPALDTPRQPDVIKRIWQTVSPVPVDIGIMEGAEDVVVVPADIGWSDVGSWTSVADLSPADADGNVLQGEHVALDCQDTFVHSTGRLVAALGLEGMIVVETGDAVLVCPKERAQDVKRIVEKLKQEGREAYL